MARKKPSPAAPNTDAAAERRAEALEVADQHPGEPLEPAGEPLEPAGKPLEPAGEPSAASSTPRPRKPSAYTALFPRRYS